MLNNINENPILISENTQRGFLNFPNMNTLIKLKKNKN